MNTKMDDAVKNAERVYLGWLKANYPEEAAELIRSIDRKKALHKKEREWKQECREHRKKEDEERLRAQEEFDGLPEEEKAKILAENIEYFKIENENLRMLLKK